MYLSEAREFLWCCQKTELDDYILGETEISWTLDQRLQAIGRFGPDQAIVFINVQDEHDVFEGEEAEDLSECGDLIRVVFPWNVPNYGKPDRTVSSYYDRFITPACELDTA